ncbi:exosortase/archaeosortase family protein [Candidatus Micrarchaeota archaeon]|nr:exosortase/archaeosortase family protein [Candidatus Micrarchaeota archaeon]
MVSEESKRKKGIKMAVLSREQKFFLTRFPLYFLIPYALLLLLKPAFLTNFIASLEAAFLNAAGFAAHATGSVLVVNNAIFEIIPDCAGLMMVFLFLALFYATPRAKFVRKRGLPAVAVYCIALFAFNLLRLFATLAIGAAYGENALNAAHAALWFIDAGVVLAAWASATRIRI